MACETPATLLKTKDFLLWRHLICHCKQNLHKLAIVLQQHQNRMNTVITETFYL